MPEDTQIASVFFLQTIEAAQDKLPPSLSVVLGGTLDFHPKCFEYYEVCRQT